MCVCQISVSPCAKGSRQKFEEKFKQRPDRQHIPAQRLRNVDCEIKKMSKESSGSDWTERLANDSLVRVAGCDIDGIARGKTMSKSKFLKICTGSGFGFCDVVFGWDCHDKLYTVQPENSEFSFADLLAVPDMGSFRRIPWEHNIPFFLIDFVDPKTKELLSVSPRGLLKRILSSSKKATGGLEALCGMEYEFYNFKGRSLVLKYSSAIWSYLLIHTYTRTSRSVETPDSLKTAKGVNLQALTPGMFGYSLTRPLVNQAFFEAIYAECLKFGVPLEAIHAETGRIFQVYNTCQYKINSRRLQDQGFMRRRSSIRTPSRWPIALICSRLR